jgi:Coenzyme PQQ synthesis protein D (PqqD)
MTALVSIPRTCKLRCGDAVHSRLFDREVVILDLAGGQYYALEDVGARLWSGIEAGLTLEQIAHDVVTEYDVTEERALADLAALVDEFVARGLVVRDESGVGVDDQ